MRYYAVLSRWIGLGLEANPYRVELAAHYPGAACSDWVGAPAVPTVPNAVVVGVVCDDATGAALEADVRYDGALLWSEGSTGSTGSPNGSPDDAPGAGEFGRLLTALGRLGLSASERALAAGSTPAGRSRQQIAEQLIAWLRARPKA